MYTDVYNILADNYYTIAIFLLIHFILLLKLSNIVKNTPKNYITSYPLGLHTLWLGGPKHCMYLVMTTNSDVSLYSVDRYGEHATDLTTTSCTLNCTFIVQY